MLGPLIFEHSQLPDLGGPEVWAGAEDAGAIRHAGEVVEVILPDQLPDG